VPRGIPWLKWGIAVAETEVCYNIGKHTSMLHSHSLLYQLAIQSLSTRAMPFALACNVAQTMISPICTCGGLHHRSPQASMSDLPHIT